jgi:hypothetical protein
MYRYSSLQDKQHRQQVSTLLGLVRYAKERNIELSKGELEQAKHSYYSILFDHTFRLLQKMLKDPFFLRLLHTAMDLKTGNWTNAREDRSDFVQSLIDLFYQKHPDAEPRLVRLGRELEKRMPLREFAFYQRQRQTLQTFYPEMMQNVVRMWSLDRSFR